MSHMLIQGDARHIPLADGSVHCVVTSPPYYGLRDYSCDGQIGLEPTPGDFVAEMVRVFREVRRVLRNDGCLWLNLGDSYAGSWGNQGRKEERGGQRPVNGPRFQPTDERYPDKGSRTGSIRQPGLKPKDLVGIPWRVAFALQADGWTLRSDIIWAKPNPMPESVTDRPTKSHEYLFLLAKSERYFWDADAVREPNVPGGKARIESSPGTGSGMSIGMNGERKARLQSVGVEANGRNLRSVWTIPTESYIGAHFATFPRRLVEPCIRAGTSGRGVCPACAAPWVREVERKTLGIGYTDHKGDLTEGMSQYAPHSRKMNGETLARFRAENPIRTLGWRPSCPCDAGEPIPATVFDPFIGSGTTIVVAEALGRRGVGLDLSMDYLGLARRRIERPHARIPRPQSAESSLPLFDR